jgi:thiol-disulfide isomerase/thioredoxin
MRMRPILALVLIAATSVAATPPERPSADAASRALERVAERYRTLTSYRLEGQGVNEVGSATEKRQQVTSMRFLVHRPGRFASMIRTPEGVQRMATDGDSLWTAVPAIGQYMVRPVSAIRATPEGAQFDRQIDPAAEYAQLLTTVTAVRSLGPDTVHTATGVVRCERYALTLPPPAAGGPEGVTVSPRVLWVDPVSRMVLLDSLRVEQQHPQMGRVYSTSVTRLVVAEPDAKLPDTAFRGPGEDGLRRVRRFSQPSAEHASMERRPAIDFTLETLADGSPVTLSSLKGKVVLLDFWATWCGPCRRWLPIVAQAMRAHAKDGLVVYAVNVREDEDKVRAYLEKQKLDVPVLMDLSGKVGSLYRANSIPLTVIVDRNGDVAKVMVGLHDEADLADALAEVGIE